VIAVNIKLNKLVITVILLSLLKSSCKWNKKSAERRQIKSHYTGHREDRLIHSNTNINCIVTGT